MLSGISYESLYNREKVVLATRVALRTGFGPSWLCGEGGDQWKLLSAMRGTTRWTVMKTTAQVANTGDSESQDRCDFLSILRAWGGEPRPAHMKKSQPKFDLGQFSGDAIQFAGLGT